jgi:uncharacterized protein YoaH (UPF0181 family)
VVKLPYGGVDDDPFIEDDADPIPLLAEIAKCAVDGLPMRPKLAMWFDRVWRQGRVTVRRATGRPRHDSLSNEIDAILRIEDLECQGVPTNEAVDQVINELHIKASRSSVFAWRRTRADQLAQDQMERHFSNEQHAIRRLQELDTQGTVGDAAVQVVYRELLDTDAQQTLANLRKLQSGLVRPDPDVEGH